MRDPKINPVNGDVLRLGAQERQVDTGKNQQHVRFHVEVGNRWVSSTVQIEAWRAWAKKARVIRKSGT